MPQKDDFTVWYSVLDGRFAVKVFGSRRIAASSQSRTEPSCSTASQSVSATTRSLVPM